MENTLGIDISKDKLDAYWLSKSEHKQFCNSKAGVKAFAIWAFEVGVSRVIFESTGVYHRCIETGLANHAISFARVNPRQAQEAFHEARRLAQRDPEQYFHGQACLNGGITVGRLSAALDGGRSIPVHLGIEPDRQ